MMSSLPPNGLQQSWIYKLLTGPALVTILVALMGQAMVSIVYQIVNNEQQNAAIITNAQAIKDLKEVVFNMQTPLAIKVFKLEDQFTSFATAARLIDSEQSRRLDQIDTVGTRALIVVASNQQRLMSQIDRLAERMIMTDKRIGDIDIGPALVKLQVQIDVLTQRINKIEDIMRERKQ